MIECISQNIDQMKHTRLYLVSTLIILSIPILSNAANFTSATDGNWNAGATWGNVCAPCTAGVDYPGASDNATVNTGTVTVTGTQSTTDLTIGASGIVDLGSGTLNISGDLSNSGTFTPSTGSVVLNGTGQSLIGTINFNNLSKTVSSADTLAIENIAITGALNFQGAVSNLLSLISNKNYSYVTELGVSDGTPDDGLYYPTDSAFDSDGNLYVADSFNDRIVKYASDNSYVTIFGVGELSRPYGIDVDESDNIYVADYLNDRVAKYSTSGTLLASYGTSGSGDGNLDHPSRLAVDATDNVFISDSQNQRIMKLKADGTFDNTFSVEVGHMNTIYGIDIDSTGKIYVADSNNNRIVKFNADGSFVAYMTVGDSLDHPYGVHVYSDNSIFVSDTDNSRIVQIDSSGTLISTLGSYGSSGALLDRPNGVTFKSNGDMYITDTYNHRVSNFSKSWTINSSGTKTLNYLSVKDSKNIAVQALSGSNSTDAGGNTNWTFSAPEPTPTLTPTPTPTPTPTATPTPTPAPTSSPLTQTSASGGTSVQARVANLEKLGLFAQANDLRKRWPNLFPSTQTVVINRESAGKRKFSSEFGFGTYSEEVVMLQEFLAKDKDIYPEGRVTGYFGPLTKQAVINYQVKNKIIKSVSEIGAGRFGPKTRAHVNSI